jgi:glycosyltransferase involved in cell wall biosynthesis
MFSPIGRAEARAQLGWDDGTVVLFGGRRLDPTKNYVLAQAAVQHLVSRGETARLVPLEGVPHERVPLWLCAADAVLLTSLREGSPNVVKESMACNAPVVAVDVGDVAWLLAGVPNARVCAYDPQVIGDALLQVLRIHDEGGRRRLEQLGLDDAAVAARLEAVYRNVKPGALH